MKKLLCVLVCLMMSVMMFTACGKEVDNNKEAGTKAEDKKEVTINVANTADALLKDVKFVDQMTAVTSVDFFAAVFSVKAEDVKEQATYTSTGATAELIAAVKCTDEAAATRVKAAFEKYAADNSKAYADYKPEECTKLDNPVIKVYNQYVIVCISDDNDTATKTIEAQVK